jgi:uncharacterized protein (TIGR03437 family)
LNQPEGIAVDASGNIYFADYANYRIRKVSNGIITTVAGNGSQSISGDAGLATSVGLYYPEGVALDGNGNLYIADRAFVLQVSNGFLTNVSAGYQIADPRSVAVDNSGNVYIREEGRVSELSNSVITTVAGNAVFGFSGDGGPARSALMGEVGGIGIDPTGNIYIGDSSSSGIRKTSNGVITTIAGNGTQGFSGDGGPATAAELYFPPDSITVDRSGNVYFADGVSRVRELVPSGSPCPARADPTSISVSSLPQSVDVAVQTGAGCTWAVQSVPSLCPIDAGFLVEPCPWIGYVGGQLANGPATLTFTIEPNFDTARSAVISVAGTLISITQQANGPNAPTITQAGIQTGIVPIYGNSPVIQPGSWISIYGSNFDSAPVTWNGDFPTLLGGVSVTIDGKLGYLWYVGPGQINLQAPDDMQFGPVDVIVTNLNGAAQSFVTLAPIAPSFSMFDSKYAAGIILTPDGSGTYGGGTYDFLGPVGHFSFSTRPAKGGENLELFGVGFGPTNPLVPAGQAFSASAPMTIPMQMLIGGVAAQVLFSGLTEAGLYQFDVVVPNGLASGDQLVQVVLGGFLSPTSTYIAVE